MNFDAEEIRRIKYHYMTRALYDVALKERLGFPPAELETSLVDAIESRDEQRAGRESLGREVDRRSEDVGEGKRTETVVQRQPSVDAARHRHRTLIVTQRHRTEPFGAHRGRIASGPGPSAGVERDDLVTGVHEREEITPETAQMRTGDRQGRVGGDRRVDTVAASGEHRVSGSGGEVVGARHEMAAGSERGQR